MTGFLEGTLQRTLLSACLVPMFLRLTTDHEELLDYEPAVLETADLVVPPEQAAFVWQFVVGRTKPDLCTFLLVFFSAVSQSQAHLI